MDITEAIREMVREEIAAHSNGHEPELLSVKDFLKRHKCVSENNVRELIRNAATNGFPVVQLGPRTTLIDNSRFAKWVANGGVTKRFAEAG